MASIVQPLRAEMEDGSTHEVVADQRDIAAWEVEPFGMPYDESAGSRPMAFTRYLAWHALVRTKQIKLSRADFEAQCVEASTVRAEGGVADDATDPGRTARSGARSSSSRGRRAAP